MTGFALMGKGEKRDRYGRTKKDKQIQDQAMEMPTDGCRTINIHADGSVYVPNTYPTEVSVCVSVPTPHGELVDIRPLMRGLYEEICTGEVTYTSKEVYEMLEREAPTIIEAEEER